MEMNAGAIAQEPLLDRSVVDEFVGEIGVSAAQCMSCAATIALRSPSRRIPGSGGTFGMMRLSWLARELERKSATIAPGAYPAAVQQLLEVYRGARHELLAHLDKVASARAGSEN